MKNHATLVARALIGLAAASPIAAHAALLTFTSSGSTAVAGSFNFDTTTRGFSAVNLRFSGVIQAAPYSFTLNDLGPQSIPINTGPGVGVATFFGGQQSIAECTLVTACINFARSDYLGTLFNGAAAPAVGTSQTIQWNVGQLDGESFLLGQTSANVSFAVTAVPEPGSWALMAAGLLALTRVTRLRRSPR